MCRRRRSLAASRVLIGSRQPLSSLRAFSSDAVHEDPPCPCGGVRCGVPAPGLRRGDDGGPGRGQQQQLDAHARGRGAPCLSCPSAAADLRMAETRFPLLPWPWSSGLRECLHGRYGLASCNRSKKGRSGGATARSTQCLRAHAVDPADPARPSVAWTGEFVVLNLSTVPRRRVRFCVFDSI